MIGMYQLLIEKVSNSNQAFIIQSRKNILYLFLTLLTVYSCLKTCVSEKYVKRIYHQLHKNKCHIYNNIFAAIKETDRSKNLDLIFDLLDFLSFVFPNYTSLGS